MTPGPGGMVKLPDGAWVDVQDELTVPLPGVVIVAVSVPLVVVPFESREVPSPDTSVLPSDNEVPFADEEKPPLADEVIEAEAEVDVVTFRLFDDVLVPVEDLERVLESSVTVPLLQLVLLVRGGGRPAMSVSELEVVDAVPTSEVVRFELTVGVPETLDVVLKLGVMDELKLLEPLNVGVGPVWFED